MMRALKTPLLPLIAAGLLLIGCGEDSSIDPTEAQHTYGASVDATDAIPVPAVAAEPDRYRGRRVTVDGRIGDVRRDGCTLQLQTGARPPLHVDAARTAGGACRWHVPDAVRGFAVAAGTLRTAGDTLRLSATGVQITPLQPER